MTSTALDPAATRLNEAVYQLKTGQPVDAVRGLEDRLKVDAARYHNAVAKGVDGIKEELEALASVSCTSEKAEIMEWTNYILCEPASEKEYNNGLRDKDRSGMRLAGFVAHENARAAGLTVAEVAGLRFYSTHLYRFMNIPLRDDERYLQDKACPLPVTTYFAVQGIKKLRALKVGRPFPITLWRGMRNRTIAENFRSDGGTELAFMSTTSSLEVAVRYSLSREALLLRITVPDFMAVGADLRWLSAFPGEAEVLYPPLTYLKPTGRRQEVSLAGGAGEQLRFTVVEVTPVLG